ncbi:MAG: hypothetical protein ACK5VW_05435, partial [Holosporales bacterium]
PPSHAFSAEQAPQIMQNAEPFEGSPSPDSAPYKAVVRGLLERLVATRLISHLAELSTDEFVMTQFRNLLVDTQAELVHIPHLSADQLLQRYYRAMARAQQIILQSKKDTLRCLLEHKILEEVLSDPGLNYLTKFMPDHSSNGGKAFSVADYVTKVPQVSEHWSETQRVLAYLSQSIDNTAESDGFVHFLKSLIKDALYQRTIDEVSSVLHDAHTLQMATLFYHEFYTLLLQAFMGDRAGQLFPGYQKVFLQDHHEISRAIATELFVKESWRSRVGEFDSSGYQMPPGYCFWAFPDPNAAKKPVPLSLDTYEVGANLDFCLSAQRQIMLCREGGRELIPVHGLSMQNYADAIRGTWYRMVFGIFKIGELAMLKLDADDLKERTIRFKNPQGMSEKLQFLEALDRVYHEQKSLLYQNWLGLVPGQFDRIEMAIFRTDGKAESILNFIAGERPKSYLKMPTRRLDEALYVRGELPMSARAYVRLPLAKRLGLGEAKVSFPPLSEKEIQKLLLRMTIKIEALSAILQHHKLEVTPPLEQLNVTLLQIKRDYDAALKAQLEWQSSLWDDRPLSANAAVTPSKKSKKKKAKKGTPPSTLSSTAVENQATVNNAGNDAPTVLTGEEKSGKAATDHAVSSAQILEDLRGQPEVAQETKADQDKRSMTTPAMDAESATLQQTAVARSEVEDPITPEEVGAASSPGHVSVLYPEILVPVKSAENLPLTDLVQAHAAEVNFLRDQVTRLHGWVLNLLSERKDLGAANSPLQDQGNQWQEQLAALNQMVMFEHSRARQFEFSHFMVLETLKRLTNLSIEEIDRELMETHKTLIREVEEGRKQEK